MLLSTLTGIALIVDAVDIDVMESTFYSGLVRLMASVKQVLKEVETELWPLNIIATLINKRVFYIAWIILLMLR